MDCTRELFSKHSLRCTRQRMAVYESLCDCKSHPTAEELFRLVKPRTSKLSLATVYNALEALSHAGLVRRMPTANGCCRYDSDTTEHLHVCLREGGEIADVPRDLSSELLESLPPETLQEVGRRLGLRIHGVSIQLHASRDGANGPDGAAQARAGNGR